MKRRILYGGLLLLLGANLFLGAQIYFSSGQGAEKEDPYPQMKLFSIVVDRVRNDYVDGGKLTYQELIHGALKGMLSTLDPHSEFMEPIKYDELKKDTQGEFGGVGIVISMKDNYITVVSPMDDTPGFRAGILSGDRIIKINGKSTERLGLPEAVKMLRGEPGTEVSLTVLRPSSGAVKDHKLARASIKVDTIKDIAGKREFPLSENNVGYIRVVQFGEQTASDLEDGLRKLEAKGMESLIIDLRGNPGGLLDQAVKVCEKFLPRNQLVVSTEGRDAHQKAEYRATGRDRHPNLPIVVLVNYGSASASEIVAGCLQDATGLGVCKAIIVGEQTFGKGSVQSILPLQDGSALRLTTAKYYTPSHKVIHEKGITPDIIVPMSDDDLHDAMTKRTVGGLDGLKGEQREKILSVHDAQLERAEDVLKGITLYARRMASLESTAGKRNEKVAAAKD